MVWEVVLVPEGRGSPRSTRPSCRCRRSLPLTRRLCVLLPGGQRVPSTLERVPGRRDPLHAPKPRGWNTERASNASQLPPGRRRLAAAPVPAPGALGEVPWAGSAPTPHPNAPRSGSSTQTPFVPAGWARGHLRALLGGFGSAEPRRKVVHIPCRQAVPSGGTPAATAPAQRVSQAGAGGGSSPLREGEGLQGDVWVRREAGCSSQMDLNREMSESLPFQQHSGCAGAVLGSSWRGSSAQQGKGLKLCPRSHTGFKRHLQVLSKLCPVWGHSKTPFQGFDCTVYFTVVTSWRR